MSNQPPNCATCGKPRPDKFCPHCGEKRVEPADHALKHVLGHLFEAFTHADGKIFLTLRTLLLRPGRLTADYVRGRRRPYIPALQVFLIANLIFFLLHPLIGGSNTLTTDLDTHLHYLWHSAVAQAMVAPRLVARGVSLDAYAAVFNPAAVARAKTLVILVVPMFALAAMALYWRRQRHCTVHLVFALHVCAFWLLFVCASLTLTNLALGLLRDVHVFPSADAVTRAGMAFSLVVMTVYLFNAVRAAFEREAVWMSWAKAAVLAVALELALQVYRLALFFITFWST